MYTRTLYAAVSPLRRVLVAALAIAIACAGLVAVRAATAGAEDSPEYAVAGGHIDWGVKQTFRNYITGPIAHGSIEVSDGATTNPDGTFRFPATSGSVQDDTVDASSDGTVSFKGHEFVPGDFSLELTLSDPRIQIDGDEGALVVDIVSKSLEGGELVDYPDTHLLDLDLSGVTPSTVGDTTTWANVPSTITEEGFEAFAEFYPAGTEMDPVTIVLQLEEVEPPVDWNPKITVSKSTDVDYGGETVTVTGTGFDPNANLSTRPPIPVGSPTGVYVVFGKFADTWAPSEGAPATARRVISQKWALPQSSIDQVAPNPLYVPLQADGSFSTTLDLAPDESLPEDFSYGIVTYAAGGAAANASQETFTPVTFADPPVVWEPEISVSKTTDVDYSGETVTVTGTGFDPNANISTGLPVPAGLPSGVFVVFGKFADTWQPSEGAPSSARRQIDTKWPMPQASIDATEAVFGPDPRYVPLQPDGSFELTLDLAPDESLPEDFDYGIATYPGGVGTAANPSQETFTPVTFADPPVVWEPEITVSKSTDVDDGGETVTVTGTGFDPNANISTRPPVPVGMATGVYVVFGKFADTWAPSDGAPSSARRVIDQKWALPAASKAAAEAAFGPNAQYVVLQPDGSFELTLHLAPNEALPEDFNYGIVTYAAGGAAPNASQETFTPVSFADPPEPEPIRIEGTVTDASGDPVEGVLVMGYKDGDTWVGSVADYTDEDGFYRLDAEPGVGYAVYYVTPAGSNLIRAWALPDGDGWTTTTDRTPSDVVVVDETNRVEVIDVTLVRGGIVEGRVTEDGVGVAGVDVWLYRDSDSWVGFAAGTTDEDGYFRLEGVIPADSTIPATEFRVMFRPPVELGFGSHLWSGGATRGTATLYSVGLDETIDVSIELGGGAAH